MLERRDGRRWSESICSNIDVMSPLDLLGDAAMWLDWHSPDLGYSGMLGLADVVTPA
jgi:hypothetical protein